MAKKPNAAELDEYPFGRERSSRLLWIVPSILLHLIIFMVWLSLPEKEPRTLEERKRIVRSEQAEQLQQHVEDANLRELRFEVQRLQEIKLAMAGLRADGMLALEGFETEMRAAVDADVGKMLIELLDLQQALAKGQTEVIEALSNLADLFDTMQPLIQQKKIADVVPYAKQALDGRDGLQRKQSALDHQFLLLQAKLDAADNVVGWIDDPKLVQQWGDFIASQERALALQSSSSDEQGKIQIRQTEALNRIVEEGAVFATQVQQSLDAEKNAQLDYDTNKVLFAQQREKAVAEQKQLEVKLKALNSDIQKVREARKRLSGQRGRINHKTPNGQEKRAQVQVELNEQDRQYALLTKEKRGVETELRKVKQLGSKASLELRRLRPPSTKAKNDRQRLIENMSRNLKALEDKAGNPAILQEAYNVQQAALQKNQALIKYVTQSMVGTP